MSHALYAIELYFHKNFIDALLLFLHPQAQPGQLASGARTSPGDAEAFWRAALPGSPMPDAIFELLHHGDRIRST
jgi:hypothetical protein